jgi:hypothetical protein
MMQCGFLEGSPGWAEICGCVCMCMLACLLSMCIVRGCVHVHVHACVLPRCSLVLAGVDCTVSARDDGSRCLHHLGILGTWMIIVASWRGHLAGPKCVVVVV